MFFSFIFISLVTSSEVWEDSPALSELWESIHGSQLRRMELLLIRNPSIALARATDGRGGAWWGWEYNNPEALAILSAVGVDILELGKDAHGLLPKDLCKKPNCNVDDTRKAVEQRIEPAKKRLVEAKRLIEAEEEAEFDEDDLEDVTPGKMNEIIPEAGLTDDDEDEL